MNYKLTHVRLLVNNFKECFYFYRDVMGFEYRAGEETGPYVEFFAGENVMLGLFERGYMANVVRTTDKPAETAAQDTMTLCFEVTNVDETAAKIKQAGIALINEPMDIEQWVLRVAHFRDSAGNLIEINHNLPNP
jgi:predicted enzyme related to lactoylglutathione lyase